MGCDYDKATKAPAARTQSSLRRYGRPRDRARVRPENPQPVNSYISLFVSFVRAREAGLRGLVVIHPGLRGLAVILPTLDALFILNIYSRHGRRAEAHAAHRPNLRRGTGVAVSADHRSPEARDQ